MIWEIVKFPNFEYYPAGGWPSQFEAGARVWRSWLGNTQNLGISEFPKSFQNPFYKICFYFAKLHIKFVSVAITLHIKFFCVAVKYSCKYFLLTVTPWTTSHKNQLHARVILRT